jgi:phosphatidylglycerophosphatase A
MQPDRLSLLCREIATQGAVGYSQAPGTVATIMSIPLIYFLRQLHMPEWLYVLIIVIGLFSSLLIVRRALRLFTESDPSEIVIDEMIGFLCAFIAVPFSWPLLLVAFVMFRLIDIYKLFGIAYIERLHGAWGIMLDDVAAGLLTNSFLQLLLYLHWFS